MWVFLDKVACYIMDIFGGIAGSDVAKPKCMASQKNSSFFFTAKMF